MAGGDGTSRPVGAGPGRRETEAAQGLGRVARELPCGDEQSLRTGANE
jgi:hypothetical protein